MSVIKDISEIFNLILNDKPVTYLSVLITFLIVVLAFFFSPLAAFVIYFYYILGFAFCWSFIKYQDKATVYIKRLARFYRGRISVRKRLKYSCSICDDLSCKRHQQHKSTAPWKNLQLSKDLNTAMEHFSNRIIDTFITSWYGQFTDDKDFLNELKFCLRFASASIINRFLEVNSAEVIAGKLLPCVVKHIDDYMYMQQFAKLKDVRFNDVIVEYLGKRLHAATTSRKNELSYLRFVVAALMPCVLPESYLLCKNYSVLIREILAGWVFLPLTDVLADPNLINSLVILAITYKPSSKVHYCLDNVEYLQSFVDNKKRKKSSFSKDLNTIKTNTDLFYALMQFLKKQNSVHLLQFCLSVDEFNRNKIHPSKLSKKQLDQFHTEALTLYKEYLDKDSLNFIGCSLEISEDFNNLLKGGVYCVAKLKESKPLLKAYTHTCDLLENIWLPQFFHSNEFYSYICGSKIAAAEKTSRRKYEANQGTVSKISSSLGKIRGVLKTQPIEGAMYPIESHNVEDGTVEDIFLGDCDNLFRDLSTWRVFIPDYQASPTNKVIQFCVYVQRLDANYQESKNHWMVLRKDQDFYTLKAKLVEFHGESEISDSPLPSRKAGSSIDLRQTKYEEFLRSLLQKHTLRGSDLLYTFLTVEDDFSVFVATNAPISQDLGNIYQSVAQKLRKEKGQHLDPFMSTFLNSTGQSKKLDWAEIGDEDVMQSSESQRNPPLPKTYRNHVFNDNFGVKLSQLNESSGSAFKPATLTECLFYLLKHIFKVPQGLLKIYVSICSVAQEMVDYICQALIKRLLKTGLSQGNLTYLVRLLEDVVFLPHISPNKEELLERKQRAFAELEGIVASSWWSKLVFGKNISNGMTTILEMLQNPHYNKQLVYNLLDIILLEMYPAVALPEMEAN